MLFSLILCNLAQIVRVANVWTIGLPVVSMTQQRDIDQDGGKTLLYTASPYYTLAALYAHILTTMSYSEETPFQVNIPDEKIATLRTKLERATFPDELENAGWKYGPPLADIQRLAEKWRNGYDWRKHERELNRELPMFTRDIEVDSFGSVNIHYVHKKSEVVDAIPLLFCHGCRSYAHTSICF